MPLANAADFPIWINGLIFLVAAAFIWAAGTRLVRYLDRIAEATGLGQAFVGMLMLGTITSLPEIANVATASAYGNPALAINNLLGSASINVLLLALVDAFVGRDALTSVVSQPVTMMQATLGMVLLAVVAAVITIGDVEIFGIGPWSLAIFAGSIAAFWLATRSQQRRPWQPADHKGDTDSDRVAQEAPEDAGEDASLRKLIGKTVIAAAVILVAGYALSQTGDALAEQTGLGSGLVGFLLIGVATSLPELSTITTALRIRRYEMAIGEVLGTNFVNVALILLADLVYTGGPVLNEAGNFEVVLALLGIVLTGALLVGLLERRDRTLLRMGYDSFAIMVLFAGGALLLFAIH